MWTLSQLVKSTPSVIRGRAISQCMTTITRSIIQEDKAGQRQKEVAAYVRSRNGDGDYFTVIIFYETDKTPLHGSKVWLHCACPYYTFTCEVANSVKRSSDVINSNGDAPIVRNPMLRPHLCKHLIALAMIAPTAKAKEIGIKKDKNTTPKLPTTPTQEKQKNQQKPAKPQTPGLKRPPSLKRPPGLRKPGQPVEKL